jgi:hypothetical protein
MFAGQRTRYTTRHTKISYSLVYKCSQVNLQTTPPDTPRLATASHINVRRLTYLLHHQTHQDQLQPRITIFTGQLTYYTTRHTKISYSLEYQCLQVNLPTTPPDTPRLATASHINVHRSTYVLHHQTHQDQLQPRILMFAGRLTSYTTRHTKISYSSHINVRRSTYVLHHQTHQDQLQPRISMFAGQPTSYTTRHTKISYSLAYQCLQVNLHTTSPDTPRLATASHINVCRSTYRLHHQTH